MEPALMGKEVKQVGNWDDAASLTQQISWKNSEKGWGRNENQAEEREKGKG